LDPIAIIVASCWTITGLLIIAFAIPLVGGRIAPNQMYGIRLPQAFESEEAWYAINRFGGKRLIVWAVPLILVGLGCFFVPLQQNIGLTLFVGFAPLIFVLLPCFEAWRFARRYASAGSRGGADAVYDESS
jgi:uncharacterized membrane protein